MARSYIAFIFIAVLFAPTGFAQEAVGSGINTEFGGHLGRFLPNQIEGMTEVIGLGGFRAGYRWNEFSFLEGGFIAGNGRGAEYMNIHLSFRMDIPLETVVGEVFLGPDLTHYKGEGQSKKLFGGGHIGGGVMAHLGGSLWFRSDMKFTINPGTSLYVGFGLMFRF